MARDAAAAVMAVNESLKCMAKVSIRRITILYNYITGSDVKSNEQR
jgi:hypothetical protein